MVVRPLFFSFLVLSACAFAQTPQFTIQDLGSLPNLQACVATALSQSGNVTGYCGGNIGSSLLIDPAIHGFLYSNGTMTDLNLTAESTPWPMAVNDSGTVAGAYVNISLIDATITATPFIVQQNGSISMPQGDMQGVLPFALNNAAQLAGSSIQVSAGVFNLFINSEAVSYTVGGGATSILGLGEAAFGINSTGTIAGASISHNGAIIVPLLWQNGKSQTLPILSGYTQSAATSVNDSGVAAGLASEINFTQTADPLATAHAVMFNSAGTVTDLGVVSSDKSSIATGINNSGWVVGFSSNGPPDFTMQLHAVLYSPTDSTSTYRAFLYASGKMYDLATLVTNGTGWSLAYATAINNAGQIIGTGIFQSATGPEQHGFLLTPVPATSTPSPNITAVVGAGLSVPAVTTISANGLFTIYGNLLASTPASVTQADIVNNQLPTNLGATCVESGATKWGVFYVSAGQVNALAGDLPSSGTVPVSVVTNCGTANEVATPPVNVPVAPASPEFLYFVANANGKNPVVAIEALTGALVGAPGLIASGTFAPAHSGDILTAFGVAWGATTSTDPIGTLDTVAETLTSSHSLTLGDKPVDVSYAGLTPTFAGLYQVNFTVPSGLAAGDQPLVLTVNGTPSPTGPYITIAN
jgi:uncharacterized protein (TIGR03437 family)